MPDTGWLSPSTHSVITETPAWVNPTNLYDISTTSYGHTPHSTAINQLGQRIYPRALGAAVPADATITGVEVSIRRAASVASLVQYNTVNLSSNTFLLGTNQAPTTNWATTIITDIFGGPTNTMGANLTPSSVNSANFGVNIRTQRNGTSTTSSPQARVYDVKIRIHYTEPPPLGDYITNFSNNLTSSGIPTGWSGQWDNAGSWEIAAVAEALGGKVLRDNGTTNIREALSYDVVNGGTDGEILIKTRAVGSVASNQNRAILRGGGTDVAEDGYFVEMFGGTSFRVLKYVGATATILASDAYPWTESTWYWIRFRAQGTTLQARIWMDGEQEPTTVWHLTVTDTSHTDGFWGVGRFTGAGTNSFDYVAVHLGTGTAIKPLQQFLANVLTLTRTAQNTSLKKAFIRSIKSVTRNNVMPMLGKTLSRLHTTTTRASVIVGRQLSLSRTYLSTTTAVALSRIVNTLSFLSLTRTQQNASGTVSTLVRYVTDTFTAPDTTPWDVNLWTTSVSNANSLMDIQTDRGRGLSVNNGRCRAIAVMPVVTDVLVKVLYTSSSVGANDFFKIAVRGPGTWTTTSSTLANFYFLEARRGESIMGLYKFINGTTTQLDSIPFAINNTLATWMELESVGTTIRAKAWDEGTTEPVEWQMSVTDTDLTEGVVQVGYFPNTTNTTSIYVDDVEIYSGNTEGTPLSFGIMLEFLSKTSSLVFHSMRLDFLRILSSVTQAVVSLQQTTARTRKHVTQTRTTSILGRLVSRYRSFLTSLRTASSMGKTAIRLRTFLSSTTALVTVQRGFTYLRSTLATARATSVTLLDFSLVRTFLAVTRTVSSMSKLASLSRYVVTKTRAVVLAARLTARTKVTQATLRGVGALTLTTSRVRAFTSLTRASVAYQVLTGINLIISTLSTTRAAVQMVRGITKTLRSTTRSASNVLPFLRRVWERFALFLFERTNELSVSIDSSRYEYVVVFTPTEHSIWLDEARNEYAIVFDDNEYSMLLDVDGPEKAI